MSAAQIVGVVASDSRGRLNLARHITKGLSYLLLRDAEGRLILEVQK